MSYFDTHTIPVQFTADYITVIVKFVHLHIYKAFNLGIILNEKTTFCAFALWVLHNCMLEVTHPAPISLLISKFTASRLAHFPAHFCAKKKVNITTGSVHHEFPINFLITQKTFLVIIYDIVANFSVWFKRLLYITLQAPFYPGLPNLSSLSC